MIFNYFEDKKDLFFYHLKISYCPNNKRCILVYDSFVDILEEEYIMELKANFK